MEHESALGRRREIDRVRVAQILLSEARVVTPDAASVLLDATGLVGASVAFCIGLVQYRRAQQWKRAEFLAKEMKELASDLRATIALTMVDWPERLIRLYALGDAKDETLTLVTYAMQSRALRPHVINGGADGERVQAPQGVDGLGSYSREETLIRDCYDALLDRMDRLGAYLNRRLVAAEDIAPYIGYYVDDIAEMTTDPTEALWTISLLTYIHFYHFTNVPALFRALHHDVSPTGKLFKALMKVVPGPEFQFAETLQRLAEEEALKAS